MDNVTAEAVLDLWAQIVSGMWELVVMGNECKIVLTTTEDDYIYDDIYDASEACMPTIAEWIANYRG